MMRSFALRGAERLRSKVSIHHLERGAYVYVRQSTQKQVRDIHRMTQLGNYEELVGRISRLASEGHKDTEIARRLSEEGFRSARLPYIDSDLVARIRTQHGQPSLTGSQYHQEKIDGCWSVPGLARRFGLDESWLRKRLAAGRLAAKHHPTTRRWLIEDDPQLPALIEKLLVTDHRVRRS